MSDAMQRFTALKQKIEEADRKRSRLAGRRDQLQDDLEKLGCKTLEEADEEIARLSSRVNELETELEEELDKLEAQLTGDEDDD